MGAEGIGGRDEAGAVRAGKTWEEEGEAQRLKPLGPVDQLERQHPSRHGIGDGPRRCHGPSVLTKDPGPPKSRGGGDGESSEVEFEPGGGRGDDVESAPRRALGRRVGRRSSALAKRRWARPAGWSQFWLQQKGGEGGAWAMGMRMEGGGVLSEGGGQRGGSSGWRGGGGKWLSLPVRPVTGWRGHRWTEHGAGGDAPQQTGAGRVQLGLGRELPREGWGCVLRRRPVLAWEAGVSPQWSGKGMRRRTLATPVPLQPATGLLWPRSRGRCWHSSVGGCPRSAERDVGACGAEADATWDAEAEQVQMYLVSGPLLAGLGRAPWKRLDWLRIVAKQRPKQEEWRSEEGRGGGGGWDGVEADRRGFRRCVVVTPAPLLPETGLLWPRERRRCQRICAGGCPRSTEQGVDARGAEVDVTRGAEAERVQLYHEREPPPTGLARAARKRLVLGRCVAEQRRRTGGGRRARSGTRGREWEEDDVGRGGGGASVVVAPAPLLPETGLLWPRNRGRCQRSCAGGCPRLTEQDVDAREAEADVMRGTEAERVQLYHEREPPPTGLARAARKRLVLGRCVAEQRRRTGGGRRARSGTRGREWEEDDVGRGGGGASVVVAPAPLLPETGLLWPRNRGRCQRSCAGGCSRLTEQEVDIRGAEVGVGRRA